jgi:hypothetical protein
MLLVVRCHPYQDRESAGSNPVVVLVDPRIEAKIRGVNLVNTPVKFLLQGHLAAGLLALNQSTKVRIFPLQPISYEFV